MLKHKDIWKAIDLLAESHGLSASGLAKKAGLDSTSFNPSKRIAKDGKPRWPSTESLSKILDCTGEDFNKINQLLNPDEFEEQQKTQIAQKSASIPVISCAKASQHGNFDVEGLPMGDEWDTMEFPAPLNPDCYALEVSDDSMLPVYRQGDILIVDPNIENLRRGDRIVIKTVVGNIMAKHLNRMGEKQISMTSLTDEYLDLTLDKDNILWIARILWVSQ